MEKQTALTLGDLENGDIFVHAKNKSKKPKKFTVFGNSRFNGRHGGAVRNCKDGPVTVSKSCRLEVIKTGVSLYAEKIKESFNQKK